MSPQALVLQDIIDTILPCAIDLAIVMGMYTLIKKKVGTGWLLLTCIVGGIVVNALRSPGLTGLPVEITHSFRFVQPLYIIRTKKGEKNHV